MDNNLFESLDDDGLQANAKIKVIGVGGGGSNAVQSMLKDKDDLVEYWVMNTDAQALSKSKCDNKLVLGRNITRGLGAGGLPSNGKAAAEDTYEEIKNIVAGCDMIFIAAGEGGGTGTGAAPVVARAAKEEGCLVLGIVTRPFGFEGKRRRTNAIEGISALKEYVDALIVVSNDQLCNNEGSNGFVDSFAKADGVLASAVKTITDIILIHGYINLDFADVKNALTGKGIAMIGLGEASGENRAIEAAKKAISSPLLEASIRGSKTMIVNFTMSNNTELSCCNDVVDYINEEAVGRDNNEVDIIFGIQLDESLGDTVKVAIIATDFDKEMDFTNPVRIPAAKPKAVEPVKDEKTLTATEKRIIDNKTSSIVPDFLKGIMSKKQAKNESINDDNDVPVVSTNVAEAEPDLTHENADEDDEPVVIPNNPNLN